MWYIKIIKEEVRYDKGIYRKRDTQAFSRRRP